MKWIPDPTCGSWITQAVQEPVDDSSSSFSWFVPAGFEVYLRVLHPFTRSTPDPESLSPAAFSDAEGTAPFTEEDVTWAAVARTFSTGLTATSSPWELFGLRDWDPNASAAHLGSRYEQPGEGSIPPRILAAVLTCLSRPEADLVAGIWEGWGGLTSGSGAARAWMVEATGDSAAARLAARLQAGALNAKERLRSLGNNRPGSGVLPAEVAAGPMLRLPLSRNHFLLACTAEDFTSRSWVTTAPWLDEWEKNSGDQDPEDLSPQSPSLLWPADRSWFLACEVDDPYTVVGCDRQRARALLAHPDLEVQEITDH